MKANEQVLRYPRRKDEKISFWKSLPFFIMHLMPFGAFFTEIHWLRDLSICVILYYLRMFFITGGYHRYFAHRSYKLGRMMQFIMAFGGCTAAQKGPLWWASYHRHHHKYSDMPDDIHSPKRGFWWSHMGWIICKRYEASRFDLIPDFTKYPELRFLNKFYLLPPILLGAFVFFAFGPSALFIGFFLSTVLLYHGTFTINSLSHVFGRRRYVTTDTSRNNFLLALVTLGEGWHNNHHHFPSSTSQGHYWWEIDGSYYTLKFLEWLGLAKDVRRPAKKVLTRRLVRDGFTDIGMFQTYMDNAIKSMSKAIQNTGEMCDEKKQALETLLQNTMAAAEKIAAMPVSQTPVPNKP